MKVVVSHLQGEKVKVGVSAFSSCIKKVWMPIVHLILTIPTGWKNRSVRVGVNIRATSLTKKGRETGNGSRLASWTIALDYGALIAIIR
jgi:hypothetical protein